MDIRGRMRALYGEDVRLKLVSMERGLFRRRAASGVSLPGAEFGFGLGGGFAGELIAAFEERALWARFGL
jgi:hypothetical protein